jgi:hypothetical protein
MERAGGANAVRWGDAKADHLVPSVLSASRVRFQLKFTSFPSEQWLEGEAGFLSNQSDYRETLTCCVRIIQLETNVQQGLMLANDVNRLGWATVVFCPSDGTFRISRKSVVRQTHEALASSDGSHGTRIALDHLLTTVLATALACLRLQLLDTTPAPGRRLWSNDLFRKPGDAVACWVISRLVRWNVGVLEPDSPAFDLIVGACAGCLALVNREATESQDYGWSVSEERELRASVTTWITHRRSLGPQDEAMLDVVLHDLDHLCRWALRNQMPSTSGSLGDSSSAVLAKCLPGSPELWIGLTLSSDDLTVIASVGLNLEQNRIAKSFARQLFGFLPVEPHKDRKRSALNSPGSWVSTADIPVAPGFLQREIRALLPLGSTLP